ncbi:hypothetical protein AVDCRST_MAG81-2788 [uncultured Synechococcales cyanobacterium]|uniref:Uncharacterized protein n=1 Tax=uncultured Synechococcales cyanobacterium TaxID=1936017 RepID=A0A6J4VML7_9CYAN|nr:hypothetical protein AVDCRST_MAG81-2788 [uncultured Synechococcales cyanobacterium]
MGLDYGSSAILVMPGVAVAVAGSMNSIIVYLTCGVVLQNMVKVVKTLWQRSNSGSHSIHVALEVRKISSINFIRC